MLVLQCLFVAVLKQVQHRTNIFHISLYYLSFFFTLAGAQPEDGYPDLTMISNLDEKGINLNLSTRYKRDEIYVCIN